MMWYAEAPKFVGDYSVVPGRPGASPIGNCPSFDLPAEAPRESHVAFNTPDKKVIPIRRSILSPLKSANRGYFKKIQTKICKT